MNDYLLGKERREQRRSGGRGGRRKVDRKEGKKEGEKEDIPCTKSAIQSEESIQGLRRALKRINGGMCGPCHSSDRDRGSDRKCGLGREGSWCLPRSLGRRPIWRNALEMQMEGSGSSGSPSVPHNLSVMAKEKEREWKQDKETPRGER